MAGLKLKPTAASKGATEATRLPARDEQENEARRATQRLTYLSVCTGVANVAGRLGGALTRHGKQINRGRGGRTAGQHSASAASMLCTTAAPVALPDPSPYTPPSSLATAPLLLHTLD